MSMNAISNTLEEFDVSNNELVLSRIFYATWISRRPMV